ncbi:MAG: choice-of-anchor Q domain-containing protein, partial [Saprospiraceae bacterium]
MTACTCRRLITNKSLSIIFWFIWIFSNLHAQQGPVASGGMATGIGGTASYSIGLYYYTPIYGTGPSSCITITQGLQQPDLFLEVVDCNLYSGKIYVDANNLNTTKDGSSWSNAFASLQEALQIANSCPIDTILVAQGTYYPSDTAVIFDPCGLPIDTIYPDRRVSFDIPDSIVILGGYEGILGDTNSRDVICNKTILSGEIQQDGDLSNNSYHVVTTIQVDTATRIDGFYIMGGNADSTVFPFNSGGGWYNDGSTGGASSPIIRNCIFTGNQADFGGGIYNNAQDGLCDPLLINCIFNNNTAVLDGGAMYNSGVNGFCNFKIINSIISGNIAENGGGVYNSGPGGECAPRFINCVFNGNSATLFGGALYNNDGRPWLINSIIWNNSTAYEVAGNGVTVVMNSITQSGSTYLDFGGNKPDGTDPKFFYSPAAMDAPTSAGNFHVLSSSVAIDMGDNMSNSTSFDLDGNLRIQNDTIDIGAYESSFFDCTLYTAGIIYVDSSATGLNNGSSWANAYTDLQEALNAARLCSLVDSVKVAQGTYYPSRLDTLVIIDPCTDLPSDTIYFTVDSSVSFNIPDSLVVLGGYGRGDDSLTRDWVCNKTILCGDIDGDGQLIGNSLHVITTFNVDTLTLVDGFCISGGNADGTGLPDGGGGGWYNSSDPDNRSNPTIRNCIFQSNHATIYGGGLYNEGVAGRTANPRIINCSFIGNSAQNGGAINNYGGYSGTSSPLIINSVFKANTSTVAGGAIESNGGEMGNSNPIILNCIFSGNSTEGNGGAMLNNADPSGTCNPVITNTVFNGNYAGDEGGAIFNYGGSGTLVPLIRNCIFWNNDALNSGPVFSNFGNATPTVSYSIIQGGGGGSGINDPSITSGSPTSDQGGNKFDTNPLFILSEPASSAPTALGNFHTFSYSPAIDMGVNAANNYPTDLDGNLRIKNGTIDIGPYETGFFECTFYTAGIVYVDSTATGANNGSSWANAYTDLQDALMATRLCELIDTIKVAQGSYYPSKLDTFIYPSVCPGVPSDTFYFSTNRTVSFNIPDSIIVLGGYEGLSGDTLAVRNWGCNKTILCGDIDQNGDTLNNSYHVVFTSNVDSTLVVDGFYIQGGNATGTGIYGGGGGWYNEGTPGIGISTPLIKNCYFVGNVATNGGGMYNRGTSGGLSSPIVINSIFSGNVAVFGGGMFNNGGDGNSSPRLINTTFASNLATAGGAMYNGGNVGICTPNIVNSIFWDNAAGIGPVFYNSYANPTISYSLFQAADLTSLMIGDAPHSVTDGGNNKYNLDPIFLFSPPAGLTTAGDYHVASSSPVINMGLNSANFEVIDLDASPRFFGIIDMGPYEFQSTDCNLFTNKIVYVDLDATGTNNGTSWANAFNDLNLALFIANSCSEVDTIKVAQGIYYPSLPDTLSYCNGASIIFFVPSRAASFNIPDSTVVLGGYPGVSGDTLAVRDWVCNQTILCGDIGNPGDSTDNSYHVVVTTNIDTSIIDGFIIKGGNADSTYPYSAGGGWYNNGSGNGNKSTPTIMNCTITGNAAEEGAGINNDGRNGGNSSPLLINCIISGNNASLYGGGIDNVGLNGKSNPRLINCIISGNIAGMEGGGLDNYAEEGESSSSLINCVISGNLSLGDGGGMFNSSLNGISNSTLVNCILWNNSALISDPVISENLGSTTIITYSIIQSGLLDAGTDITSPTNKVQGTDPLFLISPPASAAPTAKGNFHVLAFSPAIDMGTLTNAPVYDLDGNPRPINGIVDIGAYETGFFDCSIYAKGVIYVDSAAIGLNNGTSWANAFTDLQTALMATRLCNALDTIKVAQGTYYPTQTDSIIVVDPCTSLPTDTIKHLFDRNISFNIPDTIVILGGYEGVQGDTLAERNWTCNKTILCGDIDQNGDSVNNSYHVVITQNVSNQTMVDGFCISGGNAVNGATYSGGGWYNNGSGGGNSAPVIRNCIIQLNSALQGGGLFNDGNNGNSSPTLINTIIRGNYAIEDGGGIYNEAENSGVSNPLLINCIISGNRTEGNGGGINNEALGGNAGPTLINSVLAGNYAGDRGGAIFTHGSNVNTTIWNTIVWNNDSQSGTIFESTGAGFDASYCIIQANALAEVNNLIGNKTANPLFFNAPLSSSSPTIIGNFHISVNSPAIDMGTLVNAPSFDLDGNLRPFNDSIDIGAYEFIGPDCNLFTSNVIYVDSSSNGLQDGNSWLTAYSNLQDALAAIKFCNHIDTIKVAQGTYFPSSFDTLNQCGESTILIPSQYDFFFIPDSSVVLGGYPQGGGTNDQRDPHCHLTILSGDIDHDGDSSGNSYNVVKTINYNGVIKFDGFIIEHGNAVPICEEGGGWWDGSATDSAKLYIRNTIFRYNFAIQGGGFYGEGNRDLCITSSEFYNNEAVESPSCFQLGSGGGGAYLGPIPINGDTAFVRLENVLWHDNKAEYGGALAGVTINLFNEVIDIVNNTFTLNSPDAYYNDSQGKIRILNTIMWNNGGGSIAGSNIPEVNNSLIEGGYAGMNNKNIDPLFQDPNSNFHLKQASPAIDMGENSYSNDTIDLDGLPRIARTVIDMGVYESVLNCNSDTLYVLSDGSLPAIPIDSILKVAISNEFIVLVNSSPLENLELDCDRAGKNNFSIRILRGCNQALIDSCTKMIWIIDTFPKELIGIDQVNVSLDDDCMVIVSPEDLLLGVKGCTNNYEIILQYPNGTMHYDPPNKVDRTHIGYCLLYSV